MFFFKQKTAYEMRISDWSSDVCSSDLNPALRWGGVAGGVLCALLLMRQQKRRAQPMLDPALFTRRAPLAIITILLSLSVGYRSEARRVGQECVSTCRSRW